MMAEYLQNLDGSDAAQNISRLRKIRATSLGQNATRVNVSRLGGTGIDNFACANRLCEVASGRPPGWLNKFSRNPQGRCQLQSTKSWEQHYCECSSNESISNHEEIGAYLRQKVQAISL
ncbi:hypothetical protein PoB_004343500 [Plakobranchus ocellatus]|uniref:Uncharacterized protein n=1 Tax=Plakobranchus ocellatus TaxID=259542 RepID=A0AAV4B8N4_9GAST|nr:hypothetical protein PoB_004343500 [Plakobranchus ocellatus]